MNRLRIHIALLAGSLLSTAVFAAASPVKVTSLVPADAPVVLHARSLPELRKAWDATSFAKAWGDPEIRRFLAPMMEKVTEGKDGFAAMIERDTGMAPDEFFGLFSGEAVVALKDFSPYMRNEESANPQVLVAIEIGDGVGKLKEVMAHGRTAAEGKGEQVVEEEFQGETLHVTLKPESDDSATRVETDTWTIVDNLFITGAPKSVVQEAVAALKRGGLSKSLRDNPAFASLYRNSPDTHALLHIGLDSLIPSLVEALERTQGQTDENGRPTGPAAQLASVGLTPKGMFHTLGLDALQSLDLSVVFRESDTVVEGGVRWSEQRGLLRMAAFGEPPVPRPDFVPDSWVSAGVDRFSIPTAYRALMDTLADLSPMLDGFVRQQIKGMNTQLNIDLERDLIASLGDIIVSGYAMPPSGKVSAAEPLDQFIAISLSNPKAFAGAMDALIGGSPAAQMFTNREYLGETIREAQVPNGKRFALSVTRDQLLISVGSPSMLEAAIQGMRGGAARPFWKKSGVGKALDALPGGPSSILVADLGRMMNVVVDFLVSSSAQAEQAAPEGEDDQAADTEDDESAEARTSAPSIRVDASARPSAETIAKYWSTMARGLYIDSQGIHFTLQMANGR